MDFTSLSRQQLLDLAQPCKEYDDYLKTRTKPPSPDWSDPTKALATIRHFVSLQLQNDKPDADVGEDTVHAPTADGYQLPIRVFRPAAPHHHHHDPPRLVVLWFPGGFVLGDPASMAPLARSLVKRFHLVVVAPSYRLAPEHPFPTSITDGWDAFAWLAANANDELNVDTSKGFVLGGVSSGSHIANVVAHLARDRQVQPPITGVWMSCSSGPRLAPKQAHLLPAKYAERNLSRTQDECVNSGSPELAKLMKEAIQADPDSQIYAPMIWQADDEHLGHKGFPKTYHQICGMEVSRDEQLIFNDMLKEQGTPTKVDMYPGLPHGFFQTNPDLPQSKAWEGKTLEGFDWLLSG